MAKMSWQMIRDAETLRLTVHVAGDAATVWDEVEHWSANRAELEDALAAVAAQYRAGAYDGDEDGRPLGAAYDALCRRVTSRPDETCVCGCNE